MITWDELEPLSPDDIVNRLKTCFYPRWAFGQLSARQISHPPLTQRLWFLRWLNGQKRSSTLAVLDLRQEPNAARSASAVASFAAWLNPERQSLQWPDEPVPVCPVLELFTIALTSTSRPTPTISSDDPETPQHYDDCEDGDRRGLRQCEVSEMRLTFKFHEGTPPFVELCLETWRQDVHGGPPILSTHLVTPTDVRQSCANLRAQIDRVEQAAIAALAMKKAALV